MKLVIMSLTSAAPALSNVCVLLFAVFLIFGILGLSLFMGKFHSCSDVEDAFIGGSDRINCYGYNDKNNGADFWTPKVSLALCGGVLHCVWSSLPCQFD